MEMEQIARMFVVECRFGETLQVNILRQYENQKIKLGTHGRGEIELLRIACPCLACDVTSFISDGNFASISVN